MRIILFATAAALIGFGAVPGDTILSEQATHAIIGRPATPMSYAGVARRTTYRAVTYSAATTAARQCYTRHDSYGRAVTTCY